MKDIIFPIDREILISELKPEFRLRMTNKAGNEIYVIKADQAPNVMLEIGRLRELSFRAAGGGTGHSVDIDEMDTHADGYTQLIVWSPQDKEIIGGYRYIMPRTEHPECMSTEHYFEFSDKFRKEYLTHTIELGRSFIQPDYQITGVKRAIFALDNLWDGLGTLVVRNPDIKYLFGKVTMYGDYNRDARNMLIYFLKKYFPDKDNLIRTKYPVDIDIDSEHMDALFVGETYADDYKILSRSIRNFEEVIPPLINAYMSLSPTMKVFDTSLNNDFGGVEETGLLITISDLYEDKIKRHTKEPDNSELNA